MESSTEWQRRRLLCICLESSRVLSNLSCVAGSTFSIGLSSPWLLDSFWEGVSLELVWIDATLSAVSGVAAFWWSNGKTFSTSFSISISWWFALALFHHVGFWLDFLLAWVYLASLPQVMNRFVIRARGDCVLNSKTRLATEGNVLIVKLLFQLSTYHFRKDFGNISTQIFAEVVHCLSVVSGLQ